jgi:hypothetical protein
MPPQQAYGLLDFVDDVLDFGPHDPASQVFGKCAPSIAMPVAPVKDEGHRGDLIQTRTGRWRRG